MSTRDIQGYLSEMYGLNVSPARISSVTSRVEEEAQKWQNRPLDRC